MNIKTQEQNYEILYPKTSSNQVENLLNDDTKEYIGLKQTATPDDAFRQLYLLNVLNDKCAFTISFKTAIEKKPIVNLPIKSNSFVDSKGNPVEGPLLTNEEGIITTFFKGGSITLSIDKYEDLQEWNQQYQVQNGEQYNYEIELTTINFQKYLSSGNARFSSNVKNIDICCLGGGGGAGASNVPNGSIGEKIGNGGTGGGGEVTIQENYNIVPNQIYSYIVGQGGTPGKGTDSTSWESADRDGTIGGNSSFNNEIIGVGGNGGSGCKYISSGAVLWPQPGKGGTSNNGSGLNGKYFNTLGIAKVSGDNGNDGLQQIFKNYEEMELSGGGGGTGAYTTYSGSETGGNGGNPGGGAGGKVTNGNSGLNGYGGGGGGGSIIKDSGYYDGKDGGAGGSGCVAIRIHLKNT